MAAFACAGTADPGPGAATNPAGMIQESSADTTAGGDLDLRLEAVTGSRPGRITSGRNPFRFGSLDASGQSPEPARLAIEPTPTLAAPPAVAPVSRRSPLKFIGVVEAPSAGLIAVLSDGEAVFQGRQGDTVEGRYRIVRVAAERVEVELLPAGGRQVLALEGL